MGFWQEYDRFWDEFGTHKKMVLSTALHDIVTSRMMSLVVLNKNLYFQTDRTFRKYAQLKGNKNVALCIDNIQIEGQCMELGIPAQNREFSDAYREYFPGAYDRYTLLENERLFAVKPTVIERWIYVEGIPYLEIFDILNEKYALERYEGDGSV